MPDSINILRVQKWHSVQQNYVLFMISKLIHRSLSSRMQFTE
jgi:hypothetical protein